MKRLIVAFYLLHVLVANGQEYKFQPGKNDEFSVAFVKLVNSAADHFTSDRGQASRSSFGDEQYLLNKTIPGFVYGYIKVFLGKGDCHLYKVNLKDKETAKTEADNLASKIGAAFGNNVRVITRKVADYGGDYSIRLQITDAKGYFLSNINIFHGFGIIAYKEFDDRKKELRKVYDFPMNYYVSVSIDGGIPDYYYTISNNLPPVNPALCDFITGVFKEAKTKFQNIRTNKRPNKVFTSDSDYDCTLQLAGWDIVITESSLGTDIKLERKITDASQTADRLLYVLIEELKPCVGSGYVYSKLKTKYPSLSFRPADVTSLFPSLIVSYYESFRKERSLNINIKAK